jgi:mediator of RNA polymerase II transcription subunit 17
MAGATSEADSDVTETKDVAAARDEVLKAIHMTHQTSMFALDFVSLLLSKENPAQAVTTFSHGLRELVGVGTLGATMLEAPTPLTLNRVPDNKMVAIGKRLIDLNKAADTALAASKRLQQEIGSETRYWSEVLAVSKDGWRTFRLPHETHTMGVKFGFTNTAPEFKTNSIAPMRRAENGSVHLEHGKMGSGSKRLQVSILENGVVGGRSTLPRPLPGDAPLQDRVKEARDTIFAQELWHEINREGRTLLSRNLRLDKSAVAYTLDATRTISIRLASLDDTDEAQVEQLGPQDAIAESLYITLCLLLCAAHRLNEHRRSEPSASRGPPPAYSLLAPIISYFEYDKSVEQFVRFLTSFTNVLRSAGLSSSITMKEPPLGTPPGVPASTALVAVLLRPPAVQFDLTITQTSRLRIMVRPSQLYGAQFAVHCLPPSLPGSQNPLTSICPSGVEEFDRITELSWYLYRAVSRALTAHYYAAAAPTEQPPSDVNDDDQRPRTGWGVDTSHAGLVDYYSGEYKLTFDFSADPATGRPELRVAANYPEAGRTVQRKWTWPGEGNLDEIVRHVLSSTGVPST